MRSAKRPSLDDVFAMMNAAFIKGGPGELLKGELLKTSGASCEVDCHWLWLPPLFSVAATAGGSPVCLLV